MKRLDIGRHNLTQDFNLLLWLQPFQFVLVSKYVEVAHARNTRTTAQNF